MLSTRLEKPDPYSKPSYLLLPPIMTGSPQHTEDELFSILSNFTRTTLSPKQFSRFPTVLIEMISDYSKRYSPLRTSPKNGYNFSIIESTPKGFRISSNLKEDKTGHGICECFSTVPLRIKHSNKKGSQKSFFVKLENFSILSPYAKDPKERGDFVIGITNLPGKVTFGNWCSYTGEYAFRVATLTRIPQFSSPNKLCSSLPLCT